MIPPLASQYINPLCWKLLNELTGKLTRNLYTLFPIYFGASGDHAARIKIATREVKSRLDLKVRGLLVAADHGFFFPFLPTL